MKTTESGLALLTAIIVSLVIAMLTIAVANIAVSEYTTAVTNEHSVKALFVAEGALERALAVLRKDGDWSDGSGADSGASASSWQPLRDDTYGGSATNKGFPPSPESPIGTYSIYLKRKTADPVNGIHVRVVGRAGRAGRTIEFEAYRLTASDFVTYSAQDMVIDQGGGNVTIHGSIYVRGSLGLKAVKTGVYNDRPIMTGDAPPYRNHLYVRGLLDMSTGNATVGLQAQPMWAVHAWQVDLKNDGRLNLWTYQLDNMVPDIPYPDVAGYVATLAPPGGGYGNAMLVDDGLWKMVACEAGNPNHLPLWDLTLTETGAPFYIPTRQYWDAPGSPKCSFTAGGVADAGNHIMSWDPRGKSDPGRLYFNSALKDVPILIPGQLLITKDVIYSGTGTIVVDKPTSTTWAMDSGGGTGKDPTGAANVAGPCVGSWSCKILSSVRASQSCGAVGSSSMPTPDLAVFIVNGSVRLNGSSTTCEQEIDAIVVAGARYDQYHKFLSMKKVQVYGVVMANKLDTSQNPDFWQVPDLRNYLPFPLAQLLGGSGGAVVYKNWRELY